MAITDRNLTAGTILKARYKGQVHSCIVMDAGEGKVGFALEDGAKRGKGIKGPMFKSPSSAGRAVMGGIACNGWRFWTVAAEFDAGNGQKAPAKAAKAAGAVGRGIARAEAKRVKKPAAKKAPKAPAVRRSPKPSGTRKPFACGECGEEYEDQDEASACLDGHRAAVVEAQDAEPQVVEA